MTLINKKTLLPWKSFNFVWAYFVITLHICLSKRCDWSCFLGMKAVVAKTSCTCVSLCSPPLQVEQPGGKGTFVLFNLSGLSYISVSHFLSLSPYQSSRCGSLLWSSKFRPWKDWLDLPQFPQKRCKRDSLLRKGLWSQWYERNQLPCCVSSIWRMDRAYELLWWVFAERKILAESSRGNWTYVFSLLERQCFERETGPAETMHKCMCNSNLQFMLRSLRAQCCFALSINLCSQTADLHIVSERWVMRCMFACCCWDSNRSFSMFLPRCETVQHFRCYVVAMPSSAKRKHAYHRESSRTSAVLASFCLVFDLWFYSGAEKTMMPFHDHPPVFHRTNRRDKCQKKKKKFVSRPWFAFFRQREKQPSAVS